MASTVIDEQRMVTGVFFDRDRVERASGDLTTRDADWTTSRSLCEQWPRWRTACNSGFGLLVADTLGAGLTSAGAGEAAAFACEVGVEQYEQGINDGRI